MKVSEGLFKLQRINKQEYFSCLPCLKFTGQGSNKSVIAFRCTVLGLQGTLANHCFKGTWQARTAMLQFLKWKILGHVSATRQRKMMLSRIKSIYPFNPFHACQSSYSSCFRVPKAIDITSTLAIQSGLPGESLLETEISAHSFLDQPIRNLHFNQNPKHFLCTLWFEKPLGIHCLASKVG